MLKKLKFLLPNIPKFPKWAIEYLRQGRKAALYTEARFLNGINARILSTNYQELLAQSKSSNISISLTTHKDRIWYLHYVLDSLFFQLLRPKCVKLYLTRGEYAKIPNSLERFFPWLEIYECQNYGSFKKFIPALQNANKDELIISLDDDYIYPPHLVSSLYELKAKNPDSIIAYCGNEDRSAPAGGTGVLWDSNIVNKEKMPFFFDEEIFFHQIGRNMDDLFLGVVLYEAGVKMRSVYDNSEFLRLLRSEFIALPSERFDAISAAPSNNNVPTKDQDDLFKKAQIIIKNAIKAKNL